jgi:SAM-dependent methyltransferase
MNEQKHWDNLSDRYNEEIFDVFQSDRNKRLPLYFARHARPRGVVLDFGCGNGKAFPYLTSLFRSVIGMDISGELLQEAKKRDYPNVQLKRADLSRKNILMPQVDFVFSCNVIMLPELEKNKQMFRNVASALRSGGAAVMVIPSLESAMFAAWQMINLHQREGTAIEEIPADDLHYFRGSKRSILQGILHIDRVPTKHYQEPELQILLRETGFQITALERLEYDWSSEFADPPRWLKDPYPWDWLVECRLK